MLGASEAVTMTEHYRPEHTWAVMAFVERNRTEQHQTSAFAVWYRNCVFMPRSSASALEPCITGTATNWYYRHGDDPSADQSVAPVASSSSSALQACLTAGAENWDYVEGGYPSEKVADPLPRYLTNGAENWDYVPGGFPSAKIAGEKLEMSDLSSHVDCGFPSAKIAVEELQESELSSQDLVEHERLEKRSSASALQPCITNGAENWEYVEGGYPNEKIADLLPRYLTNGAENWDYVAGGFPSATVAIEELEESELPSPDLIEHERLEKGKVSRVETSTSSIYLMTVDASTLTGNERGITRRCTLQFGNRCMPVNVKIDPSKSAAARGGASFDSSGGKGCFGIKCLEGCINSEVRYRLGVGKPISREKTQRLIQLKAPVSHNFSEDNWSRSDEVVDFHTAVDSAKGSFVICLEIFHAPVPKSS